MSSKNVLMMAVFVAFTPALGRSEDRAAEAPACFGLTANDADLPVRPDAVESVSRLYRNTRSGRHLLGIQVTYRSGLGVSVETLQAALEYQIANGRAHPSTGSPLGVMGVQAHARADDHRNVRAEITSDNEASARVIYQRSRKFYSGATARSDKSIR